MAKDPNFKRKLIPYAAYEIDAIEGWLDEMAKEGWMLFNVSTRFAYFRREEPGGTRFRLDVRSKEMEKDFEGQKAYYADCGWDYVTSLYSAPSLDVYRSTKEETVELHTDTVALWQSLKRGMHWKIAALLLLPAFWVWWVCWDALDFTGYFSSHAGVVSALMGGGLQIFLCLLALFLYVVITTGQTWLGLYRLRRRGREGALSARSYHTPRRARTQSLLRTVPLLTLMAALLSMLSLLLPSKDIALSTYEEPLPFPLLEEINQEEWQEMVAAEGNWDFHWQSQNWLMKNHEFLAPAILMARQKGPQIPTEDGGAQGSFFYDVDYYSMLTEGLAAQLARELNAEHPATEQWSTPGGVMVYYVVVDEDRQTITLPSPIPTGGEPITLEFDIYYQQLVLQRGKEVVRVGYGGQSDLRDFVPLYEAYLDTPH